MINLGFFLLASFLFIRKRLMKYLRYLQQEDYQPKRFVHWLWKQKAFDTKGSVALFISFLISPLSPLFSFLFGALTLFGWFIWERDPRKEGKLKLCMTHRAKRVNRCSLSLYLLIQFLIVVFLPLPLFWIAQILLFQCTPFLLILSLALLSYDERKRQLQFILEATSKLKKISPYIIGITGSYGKTSSKDALGNILRVALGATFWPKSGVNTEMGITREIRDHLQKGSKYAVVEMGAYQIGSIERLCRLTPPQAGIITSIGVAHLDRFKTQKNIFIAKSELAQAIPFDGILVCNGDNPGARSIAKQYAKKTTLLYGFDNSKEDLDCWVKESLFFHQGTQFIFQWKGLLYHGETSLLGRTALSNLAGCFAMACALGAEPEYILGAIANLKSVENRLQIHKENDVIYLKDAYNSNLEGFSSALEVLSQTKANRRFLMTPGMIELASLEKELHEKIGIQAAKICNKVVIVGELNRQDLTRGLLLGGMVKENIISVKGRKEAFEQLQTLLAPGDALLIENDLPDLYEHVESF